MLFDGRSLTVSADIQFMAVFAGFSSGRRSIMSSELHTVSLFKQYLIAALTLTFSVLYQKTLIWIFSCDMFSKIITLYTHIRLELTLGPDECLFVCSELCDVLWCQSELVGGSHTCSRLKWSGERVPTCAQRRSAICVRTGVDSVSLRWSLELTWYEPIIWLPCAVYFWRWI